MDAERDDWYCEQVREVLPELYGAARRLTSDDADAEDLVAEVVARGWMHRDGLADRARFRGWIFRILMNTSVSIRRKRNARPSGEPFDEESHSASADFSLFERLHPPFLLWWSNPEQAFLQRLLREDLEAAVDALPPEFRAVVVLCDIQGFAYREIAELLDVPIGTVKSRLARGRSLLQQSLWQHARDAGLGRSEPGDHEEG